MNELDHFSAIYLNTEMDERDLMFDWLRRGVLYRRKSFRSQFFDNGPCILEGKLVILTGKDSTFSQPALRRFYGGCYFACDLQTSTKMSPIPALAPETRQRWQISPVRPSRRYVSNLIIFHSYLAQRLRIEFVSLHDGRSSLVLANSNFNALNSSKDQPPINK